MSRLFALALVFVPSAAFAAEPTPESLLSPTTQLYFRWDGVKAHNETYKQSYWGGVMAGPSGDSLRALVAKLPKLAGNSLLAEPLLDGKSPGELKANLTDLKNASKLIEVIADHGFVIAGEVREPRPSLRGIGQALGGVLGGRPPSPEVFLPDAQLLVIVPDAGQKADAIVSALRLLLGGDQYKLEPFTISDRKGFRLLQGDGRPLAAGGGRGDDEGGMGLSFQVAWWMEGKHFVMSLGTVKPEAAVAGVITNAKAGGIESHPLFARCTQKPAFTSVARGFVDTGRFVSLVKSLAGPFVPGLSQRIDDLGLGGLKAVSFNSGFDGKESRSVWEFDLPGERKGLAKVIKNEPLGLADLPPLPPDVSRFLAVRVDPKAVFDGGVGLIEALAMSAEFGVEEGGKTMADKIRLRREFLAREFDKAVGLNMKDDVLPCLGDKVVVFQSPNEGLSVFGQVFCVSLKDPERAKALSDRIHTSLETLLSSPIKVRKKLLKGVEVRELYARDLGILTPTYAVVGNWLVVSLHPQGVQGVILRTKGDLPAWKPDAATAKRLAKLPADACALQYCDPVATVKNLCCIGPIVIASLDGIRGRFGDGDSDFDPIETGLIPNGHELSRHLFPNLTVIRDDGKTLRVEANESFSLPLEIVGVEPLSALLIFARVIG